MKVELRVQFGVSAKLHHWTLGPCTPVEWQPLSGGLTDLLVETEDGRRVWISSGDVGLAAFRDAARAEARRELAESLAAILARLVQDWGAPWPGLDFGKGLLGRALTERGP